jgi:hypothetical protein
VQQLQRRQPDDRDGFWRGQWHLLACAGCATGGSRCVGVEQAVLGTVELSKAGAP